MVMMMMMMMIVASASSWTVTFIYSDMMIVDKCGSAFLFAVRFT